MVIVEELLTPKLEAELMPMLQAHHDEISKYQDIPLEVDWLTYYTAQKVDCFVIYTTRVDGELIGYLSFYLHYHGHFKGHLFALQDSLYVKPDSRGKAGIKLIKESEKMLKKRGVSVVMQYSPAKQDIGGLFERLGYTSDEVAYSKRIG